jgi:hypothetical protein
MIHVCSKITRLIVVGPAVASVRLFLLFEFAEADIVGAETHSTETEIDTVELVVLSYLSFITLAYLSWPKFGTCGPRCDSDLARPSLSPDSTSTVVRVRQRNVSHCAQRSLHWSS